MLHDFLLPEVKCEQSEMNINTHVYLDNVNLSSFEYKYQDDVNLAKINQATI